MLGESEFVVDSELSRRRASRLLNSQNKTIKIIEGTMGSNIT